MSYRGTSHKLQKQHLTTSDRNRIGDGISPSPSALGVFKHTPTDCERDGGITWRGGQSISAEVPIFCCVVNKTAILVFGNISSTPGATTLLSRNNHCCYDQQNACPWDDRFLNVPQLPPTPRRRLIFHLNCMWQTENRMPILIDINTGDTIWLAARREARITRCEGFVKETGCAISDLLLFNGCTRRPAL